MFRNSKRAFHMVSKIVLNMDMTNNIWQIMIKKKWIWWRHNILEFDVSFVTGLFTDFVQVTMGLMDLGDRGLGSFRRSRWLVLTFHVFFRCRKYLQCHFSCLVFLQLMQTKKSHTTDTAMKLSLNLYIASNPCFLSNDVSCTFTT